MPVQAPPLMTGQPQAPLAAAPQQFADLSPLEQRLKLQREIMGGNVNSSPTSWAGGLARLIGALGSAFAARQTQGKLGEGKAANAKLLAQVLKNGAPDGQDTASFLAASPDESIQQLGLTMLESKAKANTYHAPTAEDLKAYNLDPNGKYQVDSSGKIYPLTDPNARAPAVHDFIVGGSTVAKQWDPATQSWKTMSSGPRFKPDKPKASTSSSFGDATPPWEMQ